jgi:hypothetical protein
MYQKFWNQFLIENEQSADATFNFDDEPTSPDSSQSSMTGIKAYLHDKGYELHDQLGGGADGRVFRVIEKDTKRAMALKVISPSTVRQGGATQAIEREINNYKYIMNNRSSFGEKAKYFPVIYKTGIVDIPAVGETLDGRKERAGLIFMEELLKLPDTMAKKLFAMSGKLSGTNLERRDRKLFKNKTIVKNFLKEIMSATRGITNNQEMIDRIVDDAIKIYSDFSVAPNKNALYATDKSTEKPSPNRSSKKIPKKYKFSKYGKRLMASLVDSITKHTMQRHQDERQFTDVTAQMIFPKFDYNYRRPLTTTDSNTGETPSDRSSVFVGFDDAFDEEGYIEANFSDAANLKQNVQAFKDLGIGFSDVHSQNVMMRPVTSDIVIVDVGRFRV